MYKKPRYIRTSIFHNESYVGESIETKIERMMNNKERPDGTAPLIYTERKDGVGAGFNIRSDRWELATEAKDKIHRNAIARRDNKAEMTIVKTEESGNHESTQGTGN